MARITQPEKREIQRLVKNAQAKIARLAKRGVDTKTLPGIKAPTESMSRSDVNEAKDFLKSFTNRANTRWQFTKDGISKQTANKIKAEQARVNKLLQQRDDRYADKEYKILSEKGKEVGTRRTVKDDRLSALNNRKFSKAPESFENTKQAETYLNRLKAFDKDHFNGLDYKWRKNMNDAIQKVHGTGRSEKLINHINSMSIDDWLEIMYTNDIDVSFVYTDSEKANAMAELESYFNYAADSELDDFYDFDDESELYDE